MVLLKESRRRTVLTRDALDWLSIKDLHVECIIGVFTEERNGPQPLVVDLHLGLSTDTAGKEELLSKTVDYYALTGQIAFLLEACKFRLMETAARALASYLLAPPALGEERAQIERARIALAKPKALPTPAIATLEIEREKSFVAVRVEKKAFGTVDVIYETAEAGIYRLNVAPGKEIALHVHRTMNEHELILTPGLVSQDRELLAGTASHAPHGAPRSYRNATKSYQTILYVDTPPFVSEDEIEVDPAFSRDSSAVVVASEGR